MFEMRQNELLFTCNNSVGNSNITNKAGGIGLRNTEDRLKLIYGETYKLTIQQTEKIFTVELKIPLPQSGL